MNVLRHQDERVQSVAVFAAVAIKGFQEEAHVVFDHEQSSTLPRRKCHEIGSGRGDESYGLQEQTSAAKAASFA